MSDISLWLLGGIACIIILCLDKSTEFDKIEAKAGLLVAFFALNALIVYRQVAMMIVTFVDSFVIRNRDAWTRERLKNS